MTKKSKFDEVLPRAEEMLAALDELLVHRNTDRRTFKHTMTVGYKYIRVVQEVGGNKTAFCFLDENGNILKADGWKSPAIGIRGSIFDENYSIGKGLTEYGAVYWR